MESHDAPDPVAATQQRLFGLFVSLCGNPDDARVAADADRALHDLDDLLRPAGT